MRAASGRSASSTLVTSNTRNSRRHGHRIMRASATARLSWLVSCRPRPGSSAQVDPESLEAENDESIGLLEKKAQQLRELTRGIRDEVRDHNAILDRVQGSMGGAGDMLKGSMTKFNKVFSNTENRILAYVVGGCLVIFAVCWVLFKRHG